MTNTMTEQQLAALIANVVGQVLQGQSTSPKSHFIAKGEKAAPSDLASKDANLIATFKRRGFKDVQLMDRADPSKPYNIKPYKAWIEQGRVVRKGQKGVRGLFHVHQTDPPPGKASAKPAISGEQKELFAKAKAAFKAKKAKLQPVT
jgi:hypothetical protein